MLVVRFFLMIGLAQLRFVTKVIEARQHKEFVVEHVFEAVPDDEEDDVEECST